MDELSVKALLEHLKNSDESVRDRATTELWRSWFHQKGDYGMQILRRSQVSLDAGDVRRALEIQPFALINQKLILECTARLN